MVEQTVRRAGPTSISQLRKQTSPAGRARFAWRRNGRTVNCASAKEYAQRLRRLVGDLVAPMVRAGRAGGARRRRLAGRAADLWAGRRRRSGPSRQSGGDGGRQRPCRDAVPGRDRQPDHRHRRRRAGAGGRAGQQGPAFDFAGIPRVEGDRGAGAGRGRPGGGADAPARGTDAALGARSADPGAGEPVECPADLRSHLDAGKERICHPAGARRRPEDPRRRANPGAHRGISGLYRKPRRQRLCDGADPAQPGARQS